MNFIKNYKNIDEYTLDCERNKKKIDVKFKEFINILHRIKDTPELIFTNLFSQLDSLTYAITNFDSGVLRDIILPLIKTMPQFKDIELECFDYDEFDVRVNNFGFIKIKIKYKTYFCDFKKPKRRDYEYEIPKGIVYGYRIAIALQNYYSKPNLYNWIQFLKINNEQRNWIQFLKHWIFDLQFIKNTPKIQKLINASIENYLYEKEDQEQRELDYDIDLSDYNKNQSKIENIIKFLNDLGYQEEH